MVYKIVFSLHLYVSVLTLFTGIVTVTRSVVGWSVKKDYTRVDSGFSLAFTLALYAQLLLGFIIYVMLRVSIQNPAFEIPSSGNDAPLRFWAIEHIALMILALFLTQLGRIYIKKSIKPLHRFKASLFYYGSSLVLILFSLSIALFFK